MYISRLICGCNRLLWTSSIPKSVNNVNINTKLFMKRRCEVMVLRSNNIFTSPRRYDLKNLMKFGKKEEKCRSIDNVPADYRLIYQASERTIVTVISTVTIVSGCILTCCGLYNYFFQRRVNSEFEPIHILENEVFAMSWYDLYAFAAVFVFLSIGVVIISHRHVQRIYRKDNDFLAVYTNYLPALGQRRAFKGGEAKHVPLKLGILPWSNALFKIKGKKSIIVEDRFKTYHDFKEMLGGKIPGVYYQDSDEEN